MAKNVISLTEYKVRKAEEDAYKYGLVIPSSTPSVDGIYCADLDDEGNMILWRKNDADLNNTELSTD